MLPSQQWAKKFTVTEHNIEFLTNLLLEREAPMTTQELATALIQHQLDSEQSDLEEQYEDATLYVPSESYGVGQRLMFSQMDYATATIIKTRVGENSGEYGAFKVISVEFDDDTNNIDGSYREFATEFTTEHYLNDPTKNSVPVTETAHLEPSDILRQAKSIILKTLHLRLQDHPALISVADYWFVKDLMIEIDIGPLHLAEAVLDMHGGGPLTTHQILSEIGELGDAAKSLQVFSFIHAMNDDDRFDEVGPEGEILWFLKRLEPDTVKAKPEILVYETIEYDRNMLTEEMLALEREINDELSPLAEPSDEIERESTNVTLLYPHRRAGTLPLTPELLQMLPWATTPRIAITLVDGEDGQLYSGWIVHDYLYLFGLSEFYNKHHLPVGTHLNIRFGDELDHYVVSFNGYRPRTEWIRLASAQNDRLHFEDKKRAIGASYDDLIIVGVDNLPEIDRLTQQPPKQQKSLLSIIKSLLPELGKLSPQRTVHLKTLYSAVNILKRCPPGPIFATLIANPDFEDVGGHYWKLSE